MTGLLLYYAGALDVTMLPALSTIASEQVAPTMKIEQTCQCLLDYAATYLNTFIRYYTSEIILHVESDAAYNVMPKARSRIAGYYYLAGKPNTTQQNRTNLMTPY